LPACVSDYLVWLFQFTKYQLPYLICFITNVTSTRGDQLISAGIYAHHKAI